MVDLLLVRWLPPYLANVKKRLVKSQISDRAFLVYSGDESYPKGGDIEAIGVRQLLEGLAWLAAD